MPIPATLIWKESRPVWDSSNGWQVSHTYEGTATETELTSACNDFIAGGATRIDPQKQPFKFDGLGVYSYEVTLTVTYAATGPEGNQASPADPDYGLFSRTWTLDYEDEQVPIIAGRRATELLDWDADWIVRIQTVAARYRASWATYIEAETKQAKSGTMPNKARDYAPLCLVSGSGTGPSGIARNTIAVWLFDRLTADEDATDRIKRPTLRKAEQVSPISNVRASNTDAERVFRYNTLIARETTLTASVLLNLAQLRTAFPYWFKDRPVIEGTQMGRFNIAQDYVGLADYDGIQWGRAL